MIPEDITIDIVNIFRNKDIRRCSRRGNRLEKQYGTIASIWTQLDVSSSEAALKAEQAALPYIRKCMHYGRIRSFEIRAKKVSSSCTII